MFRKLFFISLALVFPVFSLAAQEDPHSGSEAHVELVPSINTSFDVAADITFDEVLEPCFIGTDQADTVQLRVGPGTNHTGVAFLATGEEFEVAGRFSTDDGSIWYLLIKAEVLPNSEANEIWVAAADLDETGDCDAVADAAAPRPADAAGDASTAPALTTTGQWTVTFDATTTLACTMVSSTVDSDEFYNNSTAFTLNITTISDDGASFFGNGGLFERQPYGGWFVRQSDGYYVATLDPQGAQLRLLPTSDTTMIGVLTVDDLCDVTTGVTLTR